ncbi:MAG: hypothetical protein WC587_00180 [Candidatus Paceibacterota bacterium]
MNEGHEKINAGEQEISPEKERLLALEREGRFVFHGSAAKIEKLEPRQPEIFNIEEQKRETHGEPCVSATPLAEVAIFRAIINKQNFPSGEYASSFSFDVDRDKAIFKASKEVLEKLESEEYRGYVYVLNKKDFLKFSGMEWRSGKEMIPSEIIEVSLRDLPKKIRVVDWIKDK